jgi:hypothetical protein
LEKFSVPTKKNEPISTAKWTHKRNKCSKSEHRCAHIFNGRARKTGILGSVLKTKPRTKWDTDLPPGSQSILKRLFRSSEEKDARVQRIPFYKPVQMRWMYFQGVVIQLSTGTAMELG